MDRAIGRRPLFLPRLQYALASAPRCLGLGPVRAGAGPPNRPHQIEAPATRPSSAGLRQGTGEAQGWSRQGDGSTGHARRQTPASGPRCGPFEGLGTVSKGLGLGAAPDPGPARKFF